MVRKNALLAIGGYDQQFKYAQDYDLVLKLVNHGKVANLPIVLLRYRIDPNSSISFRKQKEQEKFAMFARINALNSGNFVIWQWLYLAKPLVSYLFPTILKTFILKRVVWQNV